MSVTPIRYEEDTGVSIRCPAARLCSFAERTAAPHVKAGPRTRAPRSSAPAASTPPSSRRGNLADGSAGGASDGREPAPSRLASPHPHRCPRGRSPPGRRPGCTSAALPAAPAADGEERPRKTRRDGQAVEGRPGSSGSAQRGHGPRRASCPAAAGRPGPAPAAGRRRAPAAAGGARCRSAPGPAAASARRSRREAATASPAGRRGNGTAVTRGPLSGGRLTSQAELRGLPPAFGAQPAGRRAQPTGGSRGRRPPLPEAASAAVAVPVPVPVPKPRLLRASPLLPPAACSVSQRWPRKAVKMLGARLVFLLRVIGEIFSESEGSTPHPVLFSSLGTPPFFFNALELHVIYYALSVRQRQF